MKKLHILAAGLILLIAMLLCATTAAQAETRQPKKTASQWQSEGYIVLSDRYNNFFALSKNLRYLREKTSVTEHDSGSSFTLSKYETVQTGKSAKGKQGYCIEAGGKFYFGMKDANDSSGDTLVLGETVVVDMADMYDGVVEGISPQEAMAVAQFTVGAWIDWDPRFDLDDVEIKDIPFDFHGDVHFFLDHWSDSAENTTHHTIQCYFELNMKDMGFATDTERTTEDAHVPIFSYRGIKIIYVSIKLDHFKGNLGVGFSIHDGLKIHFDTWGVVPISEIDAERDGPRYDSKVSNVACHGDVEIGFEVGIGSSVKPLVQNQSLTIGFGYTIEGTDNKDRFVPADTKVKWHACDECWNEDVRDRIGPVNVVYDLLGFDPWTWHSDDYETDPWYFWYYSKTFGDYGSGECPHYSYRLDAMVVNRNDNPIPDVSVTWKNPDSHYEQQASGTTDAGGGTVIYVKPGSDREITAKVTSPLDPSKVKSQTKKIPKKSEQEELEFVLDIPEKHVYFKNSATGEASSWPADIPFMPFFTQNVQIPDTVPGLSGRVFTEWNTKEDGTGTSYAPGVMLTLTEDLMLWAQWEIAGDSWYVIYNANGGTKAPRPQIVPQGQDAKLSAISPESGMTFLGWTPDIRQPGTVYQPGEMMKYDSKKSVVVLYALWELDPPKEPIRIAYDANGVQAAGLPRDIWLAHAAWAQVGWASPPLGSNYYFKGWSIDPKAGKAEYQPGRHYYFGKNTTLYAVWSVSPEPFGQVTITFNANGGKPDSVSPPKIEPRKTWFRLRASDPEWDAQHDFLGWATEPDAKEAVWENGSLAMFEKDTTLYAVWRAHYKVIEGAGSTWTKGSGMTQRFVADGNIAYFTELRIDGKPFTDGVRIISGSTVADISPRAMETLSAGTHEVMFVYKDGEASAPFTVQRSLPPTGDRSSPLLWLLLVVFGLAGTTLAGIHLYAGGKRRISKK